MNSPSPHGPRFGARLARFDRPAIDLAELLQADGGDFIHLAIWTFLGRRATMTEYQHWYARLAAAPGKPALLFDMSQSYQVSDAKHHVPGLLALLKLERLSRIAVIGAIIPMAHRLPWLSWPLDAAKRMSGKVRWAYRHSSKWLARQTRRMGISSQMNPARRSNTDREPVPPGTDARTADLYRQLCAQIDGKMKET